MSLVSANRHTAAPVPSRAPLRDITDAPAVAAASQALRRQGRVLKALILRDMRTRFGRTYAGYLMAVLWPLSHLLFISLAYAFTNRIAPIGGNSVLFASTGALPYILCLYPSRLMTFAIFQNKNLLQFPIVQSFDLILARGILEVLTAFAVTALYVLVLLSIGIDLEPSNMQEAVFAVCATVYLAFACGVLNAVIFMLWPAWQIVYIVLIIIAYGTAGTFILPSIFSEQVQYWLSWNPLLHCVEWLRLAYYDSAADGLLDRGYLLGLSSVILIAGLALERAARGRFLQVT